MKKAFKIYALIWCILLALFNVIAFFAGGITNVGKFTPSFWIGYGLITLALIGQLLCAKAALNTADGQKFFYNLPLITVSWTGLILSFVVGGLCMLLTALPYWVGVIVCVLVLGLEAIALLKATVATDVVGKTDERIKTQTFFMKSLTVDVDNLLASVTETELKTACKKVYEAVRYSDPMSHEALAEVEGRIGAKFTQLSQAVGAKETAAVQALADEMILLINERNNKCKLFK